MDASRVALSMRAGPSGALRISEQCKPQDTALVLATEGGLQAAEARIDELEQQTEEMAAANAELTGRADDLEGLLAGVVRADVDGHDTLQLTDMDLQLVNGTGTTDGEPNGLGNLIIGYNKQRFPATERGGSHYLVVGDEHGWTSFGGILVGFGNTGSGPWASVPSGIRNTASGLGASVSGGIDNTARSLAAQTTSWGASRPATPAARRCCKR